MLHFDFQLTAGRLAATVMFLTSASFAQIPFAQKTLLVTGDVMLDRGVRKVIDAKGIDAIFDPLDSLFSSAEHTIVNLECPAASKRVRGTQGFIFNADPAWLQALCAHNVTHVSLANNHSTDQMQQGLDATIANLGIAGLGIIGAGIYGLDECAPAIIDGQGSSIALFGAVHIPIGPWKPARGKAAPCTASGRELASNIAAYRREHPFDAVVAVLHWGVEYRPKPTQSQRDEAHMLVDSGATAVIGHHPHVVEPVEMYNGAPICYSLGNLVFDQHDPPTKQMLAAKLFVTGPRVDSVFLYPLVSRNSIPQPAARGAWTVPPVEGPPGADFVRTVWLREPKSPKTKKP